MTEKERVEGVIDAEVSEITGEIEYIDVEVLANVRDTYRDAAVRREIELTRLQGLLEDIAIALNNIDFYPDMYDYEQAIRTIRNILSQKKEA